MSPPIALTPPGPESSDEESAADRVIPLTGRQRGKPTSGATGPAGSIYQVEGSLALKAVAVPIGAISDPSSKEGIARTAVIVARALLEVLAGWRPATQLARWTSYTLQQDLERRAPRRPTGSALQLLRIRVHEQSPGIAEVCALAEDTTRRRVRVVALRLECQEGAWLVTRLQVG